MASLPNFIDQVTLYARAGKGGAGAVHFRREKFVPKGGPDGGDGGRGGHIILQGNPQLSTLLHLRYKKHVVATDGYPGEGGCRTGRGGNDVVMEVPLGTVASYVDADEPVREVTQAGQEHRLMEGGNGGKGNMHFKSPTHQAPRYAQPGTPGAEGKIRLELKLLADVGLVGLPNAGKSTLLAAVSAAQPKVANYPFTTLVPQLGVVDYRVTGSFVLADMPGIIAGAAQGKGLGIRFLKHIERHKVLLFLVAADTGHIAQTYYTLLTELKAYDPALAEKPRLLVITKADLVDSTAQKELVSNLPKDIRYAFISAVTRKGLYRLKDIIWQLLHPLGTTAHGVDSMPSVTHLTPEKRYGCTTSF
ncbi:MAG: GTPase ObgE [Bacteroidota bacterium]